MKLLLIAFSLCLSIWPYSAQAIQAPNFSLMAIDGNEITLNDYKGNVIVLEWTNYECPFVKKHYKSGNIPSLQEKYTEKGVIWMSVISSTEGKQGYLEPKNGADAVKKIGSKAVHVLRDESGYIGRTYGAQSTPHIFIIDRKGEIVYRGAIDSIASPFIEDIERAENYVSKALDEVIEKDPVTIPVTAPYGCSVKY